VILGGVDMSGEQGNDVWMPTSPSDRDAVRQQLERMLAAPLFHASKRYPSFLRFVITNTLAGQTDLLKERLLGIEIFGRAPDYDTTRDPIVRVTAAEIRKRIEQYYHEPEHAEEIRFFLPSGSYVPLFYLPGHHAGVSKHKPETNGRSKFWHFVEGLTSKRIAFSSKKAIVGVLAMALVVGATAAWYASRPPVIKRFWAPFVKTGEPVLFCIADQSQFSTISERDAADPARLTTLTDESLVAVVIDDVSPLINIAGMLRAYGKTYRVLGEATTTLNDLRRGPSVFIGAFTNSWTLRLTAPLRFHFANDAEMTRFWIEDRANPAKRDWVLNRSQQKHTGIYKDYAIVARLVDPNTDQFVVVAAGIGRGGTVAAGEFLVDAQHMNEILSHVPKDWERRNMEIVLETQVINWESGPPRIDAIYTW
jgi:hypothetical protein